MDKERNMMKIKSTASLSFEHEMSGVHRPYVTVPESIRIHSIWRALLPIRFHECLLEASLLMPAGFIKCRRS